MPVLPSLYRRFHSPSNTYIKWMFWEKKQQYSEHECYNQPDQFQLSQALLPSIKPISMEMNAVSHGDKHWVHSLLSWHFVC